MPKKYIKNTFGRVRVFFKETFEGIWLFIRETFGRVRSVFFRLQILFRVETHMVDLKQAIKRFVWVWQQRITFFCYKIEQISILLVFILKILLVFILKILLVLVFILTNEIRFFCYRIKQIWNEIKRIYKNPEGFDDILILVVVQIFVSLLIKDIIIFLHVLTRELVFFFKNPPTLNDFDLFILFSIVILFIDLFNSPQK